MNHLKAVDGKELRFGRLFATGGIGMGMFFTLAGDHTLGRNESRMGALLPCRDYCKQHIITHYVAVLLGSAKGAFAVHAIGKVGQDDAGHALLMQMRKVGIQTQAVQSVAGTPTLLSVCFQYPDFCGGNITTQNSASGQVRPQDIYSALEQIASDGQKEMILAAPEVPVDARAALLAAGRDRGALNVASVLSAEVEAFTKQGLWKNIDLLAVNIDEAAAIAGVEAEAGQHAKLIEACGAWLWQHNRKMQIIVTDGPQGCYVMDGQRCQHIPAIAVKAVSTAGAGDALIAGTMAGLCCGLPLLRPEEEERLCCAVDLGTLLAAFSVTSPHTIHPQANAESLWRFAIAQKLCYAPALKALFEDE